MITYFPLEGDASNIMIIPVQFNICFNNIVLHYNGLKSEGSSPVVDVLTSDWGDILEKFIMSNKNKGIIIDLIGIKVDQKVFNKWRSLMDTSIIYINCDELVVNSLRIAYNEELVEIRKEEGIYCNTNGNTFMKTHKLEDSFIEKVKLYYIDECARRLGADGKNETIKKNYSSNIYTSFYMDIRKLFSKQNNMNIFLYGLYKKVEAIKDYDYFVVVSNNGAVIANILSYVFKKEVLYLLNLGPRMALSNKDLKSKIKKNARYLYVYDFLCLGNELKILDMLLKINCAQLVYGIGVAQVLPSERYEHNNGYKIDSLVNLEDYNEIFRYTINLYEER